MKAELEAIGAEDFTFDEEFPADLLMRMVMEQKIRGGQAAPKNASYGRR